MILSKIGALELHNETAILYGKVCLFPYLIIPFCAYQAAIFGRPLLPLSISFLPGSLGLMFRLYRFLLGKTGTRAKEVVTNFLGYIEILACIVLMNDRSVFFKLHFDIQVKHTNTNLSNNR